MDKLRGPGSFHHWKTCMFTAHGNHEIISCRPASTKDATASEQWNAMQLVVLFFVVPFLLINIEPLCHLIFWSLEWGNRDISSHDQLTVDIVESGWSSWDLSIWSGLGFRGIQPISCSKNCYEAGFSATPHDGWQSANRVMISSRIPCQTFCIWTTIYNIFVLFFIHNTLVGTSCWQVTIPDVIFPLHDLTSLYKHSMIVMLISGISKIAQYLLLHEFPSVDKLVLHGLDSALWLPGAFRPVTLRGK